MINAVPADIAVTVHTFEALAVTASTAPLLLVHEPPASPPVAVITLVGDEPVWIVVEPAHAGVPGTANGFTLTTAVRLHVFVHVYVIVDVPAFAPVTTPVDEPTVAFAVVLLVHVPPVVPVLASVVVALLHTVSVPDMAVGSASIFTVVTLVQPELTR